MSIDATCEDIVAQGVGTVSWGNTPVTMVFAGPTAVESWSAVDNSGANGLQASGVFTWQNTTEILNCLNGGTNTVTLTGYFVIVT